MQKKDYGGVRVLLAMENPLVRQGLQTALQSVGFKRAVEVTSLERMIASLVALRYDVIITSTELGIDLVPPFMAQLRQGALVHHPLPIIVPLLANNATDYIRRVIDSGPDDLLQTPVVPSQMLTRLAVLAEKRKAFVVTSDYVGPDRRTSVRPGTLPVPLLEVPNPLAMRIARLPEEAMATEIARAADRLRAMRLARFTFELQWLLRAIRALFDQEAQDPAKLTSFCERIKTLLSGIPRLLSNGHPEQILPLIDRLETGNAILMKSGLSADSKIVQGFSTLIMTLSRALRDCLPPDLAVTTGLAPTSS